eukprot:198855_1
MSETASFLEMNAPKMKLSDIMKGQEQDEKNEPTKIYLASETLGSPSLILGDWLYLGNRSHALSQEVLTTLKITHILNITALVPNAWPDRFQYARIKVLDESSVKLYDYFEAAVCFIDLCNPLNYDINKEKRKILVHCAMGISRSATITISYLISRSFSINNEEEKILDGIQHKMALYDNAVEAKIKTTKNNKYGLNAEMFEKHRNNKDYTKRIRKTYKKSESVSYDQNENKMCNGLTLGEAYLFVLDRRSCICPNFGFCQQMEQWEKFVWDSTDTTIYQLPFFSPLLDEEDNDNQKKKVNKTKKSNKNAQQPEIDSGCCLIL